MWMLILAVALLLPVSSNSKLSNAVKQGVKAMATVQQVYNYPDASTQVAIIEERQKAIAFYKKQNEEAVANYLNQRAEREKIIHDIWFQKLVKENYPQVFAPQSGTWNWQNRQFLWYRYGGLWAFDLPIPGMMKDLKELDDSYDADKAFTEEWFKEEIILKVLKHNIRAMGIISKGQPLEKTSFPQELLDIAGSSKLKTEEKTSQIHVLLKKYELQSAVKPAETGKECLWSGHVDNSNFARDSERKMTPLETPPLMQVLSKTFGTENFKKGVEGDGFGARWLPNICPMFNAATLIYCWDMKPDEKTLPVYTNQLKSSSAFFDTEMNAFVAAGNVDKIKFIILSPPPKPAELMVVEVDVKATPQETREAVKAKFKGLPEDDVKKLYDNRFNIFLAEVNGGTESHPLDNPATGTRKESTDVSKATYKDFFQNTKFLDGDAKVAASSGPHNFDFYLLGIAALFLIVIAYQILKNTMTQKSELNIVFNMESPADQYTKFEVI